MFVKQIRAAYYPWDFPNTTSWAVLVNQVVTPWCNWCIFGKGCWASTNRCCHWGWGFTQRLGKNPKWMKVLKALPVLRLYGYWIPLFNKAFIDWTGAYMFWQLHNQRIVLSCQDLVCSLIFFSSSFCCCMISNMLVNTTWSRSKSLQDMLTIAHVEHLCNSYAIF